jgi:hypothetical protein
MAHELRLTGWRRAARFAAAALLVAAVAPAATPHAAAQDLNYLLPIPEIERRMAEAEFRIVDWRGSRAPGDRTSRATMAFDDGSILVAKFAIAPPNGSAFNNEPRYETAAYELQKLFLDPDDYVVPPTVMRSFPIAYVREQVAAQSPTFREAPGSVLVCMSYWLTGVTPNNFWDRDRARTDSVYARHVGNFNLLTHIIHHKDSNVGNFLISESAERPRVFAVDNGVAFASQLSNRGYMWRDMQVERLPRATIERLAAITREQLTEHLAVLVEFEIHDGQLVQVPPGPNLSSGRGVRRSAQRIQVGLTDNEIRDLERRIQNIVRQANGRRFELF